MQTFSIYHHIEAALYDYDYQMIFRSSWLLINYMVFSLYFAGEDIIIYVSYSDNVFFSEKNSWFGRFLSFFAHFDTFVAQI